MDEILTQFQNDKDLTKTSLELESLKVKYLGRNGEVNALMRNLKSLSPDEKAVEGQKLNKIKSSIENEIDSLSLLLASKGKDSLLPKDTTLPGNKSRIGSLHPTTSTIREMVSYFKYHGYSVYEGPEIETNEYNFDKLNLPIDHPARELQDTLYISEPEIMLRTHTSSVETRAMTAEKLPIRIVVPGKCYRNENTNMTNNAIFYQFEGLAIDKNITLADLKGTLEEFAKFLYGEDVLTRFRCKYYPQVEPGAGMDIQCRFCMGDGCQTCKYRGWIEVLGAGMVHPMALRKCGIDPAIWSGFAFGMGLDRLTMMKFGITDVRSLYNGDLVIL